MRKAGVDAVLATSPANVFYVSDYFSTGMQLGCGTQGYAFLPLDAEPALMAPLAEADLVAESGTWIKDIHWWGCLNVNSEELGGLGDNPENNRRLTGAGGADALRRHGHRRDEQGDG